MRNILIIVIIATWATLMSLTSFRLATPTNVKGKTYQHRPAHVEKYVGRFLKTAQAEAELYNIPVSIKLAQGILESNSGRSQLARKHNNHFGKKWHGSGKYAIYKDDTPKDRFQVYKSAWRSYRDHSKLLCNDRYKHLLKLHRLEYRKWAHGLKKAGYATNPKYAEALINVIEQYGLWYYDFKLPGL